MNLGSRPLCIHSISILHATLLAAVCELIGNSHLFIFLGMHLHLSSSAASD